MFHQIRIKGFVWRPTQLSSAHKALLREMSNTIVKYYWNPEHQRTAIWKCILLLVSHVRTDSFWLVREIHNYGSPIPYIAVHIHFEMWLLAATPRASGIKTEFMSFTNPSSMEYTFPIRVRPFPLSFTSPILLSCALPRFWMSSMPRRPPMVRHILTHDFWLVWFESLSGLSMLLNQMLCCQECLYPMRALLLKRKSRSIEISPDVISAL